MNPERLRGGQVLCHRVGYFLGSTRVILIPANIRNIRRWPNVDSLLGQRLRRWPNSKSTLTQRLMFTGPGIPSITLWDGSLTQNVMKAKKNPSEYLPQQIWNIGPIMGWRRILWSNIKTTLGQCLVFARTIVHWGTVVYVVPALSRGLVNEYYIKWLSDGWHNISSS